MRTGELGKVDWEDVGWVFYYQSLLTDNLGGLAGVIPMWWYNTMVFSNLSINN